MRLILALCLYLCDGLRPPSIEQIFSTSEYVLKRAREESMLRIDRLIKNEDDALTNLLNRKERLVIDKGEWVCVTGATSGIGLEVGAELAKLGYGVILCGRDEAKLKAAQAKAIGRTEIVSFDLESLESTAAGAAKILEICAETGGPKGIVLNAGAWPTLLDETEDGIELGLQANYLSQALLADRLLTDPQNASVVTLSSIAHAGYLENDLEPILQDPTWRTRDFDPNQSYAAAKLMAILYARALALTYKVRARAVHPGLVASTDLFRAFPDPATYLQTNIPDPLGLLSGPLYQAQSFSSAAQEWASNAIGDSSRQDLSKLLDATGPLKSPKRAAREIVATLLDPSLPNDAPFICDAQVTDPAPLVINSDANFVLTNRLFLWTASFLEDRGYPLQILSDSSAPTSSSSPASAEVI